eukprot:m.1210671 g.1210671  ORF g.1210671 m.1210671 type:complete len:409 (+) comp24592_c0_seq42:653-1879(+)
MPMHTIACASIFVYGFTITDKRQNQNMMVGTRKSHKVKGKRKVAGEDPSDELRQRYPLWPFCSACSKRLRESAKKNSPHATTGGNEAWCSCQSHANDDDGDDDEEETFLAAVRTEASSPIPFNDDDLMHWEEDCAAREAATQQSGQSAAAAISSETDAVHSSPEYDGRHFSVEERMLVVNACCAVCQDPVHGTDQRKSKIEDRVARRYKELAVQHNVDDHNRTGKAIWAHFLKVKRSVLIMKGHYEAVEGEEHTGRDTDGNDNRRDAEDRYRKAKKGESNKLAWKHSYWSEDGLYDTVAKFLDSETALRTAVMDSTATASAARISRPGRDKSKRLRLHHDVMESVSAEFKPLMDAAASLAGGGKSDRADVILKMAEATKYLPDSFGGKDELAAKVGLQISNMLDAIDN